MIGSKYINQNDGGWSVTIHGGKLDHEAFMSLMRWIDDAHVEFREAGEDTKKYDAGRFYLDALPDVDATAARVAEKLGGPAKIIVVGCALSTYEKLVEAIKRGEQVVVVKAGGQLDPINVDIPLQGESQA